MIGSRRSSSRHDLEALPSVGDSKSVDGKRRGTDSGLAAAGGSGAPVGENAPAEEPNTDQRGRSRSRSRWRRACCRS